jgi:hypothetical protein
MDGVLIPEVFLYAKHMSVEQQRTFRVADSQVDMCEAVGGDHGV